MKECKYPNCLECDYSDCIMENNEIRAMLKRRRWNKTPEQYRQKQREYRAKIKTNLPHCDECNDCVIVQQANKGGTTRLCIREMRLVEQKVSNCPQWCKLRNSYKKRYTEKKENFSTGQNRGKVKEKARFLYAERSEKGICTRCGKRRAVTSKKKCGVCQEKENQQRKLRYTPHEKRRCV